MYLYTKNASSKQAQAAVVEGNKRRKDIKRQGVSNTTKRRRRLLGRYESDLVRDSGSDESSSDGEEEEVDGDKEHEERQEETGTCKPGLSVFHSGLGDYLRAVRGTGSFSIKNCERRRIRELEKAALNSQSIKTMFVTQQLCISQKTPLAIEDTISQSLVEKDKKEVSENRETTKAKAVHNLIKKIR